MGLETDMETKPPWKARLCHASVSAFDRMAFWGAGTCGSNPLSVMVGDVIIRDNLWAGYWHLVGEI